MTDIRYMNWARKGEGVEIENAGDLAGDSQLDLRRLAARTGAPLELVLGRGGSGRDLFLCLPAIEGHGILTILGFNALTVESLRDWAKGFTFPLDIKATPSDVAPETTHLVLVNDLAGGQLFDGLKYLPELPNLEQITFVPPFDPGKGLEVPDWISECTFIESIRADSETCYWTLITTQSFPERTTRTTSRIRVDGGIEHWTPPGFARNLNERCQASEENWCWSDFSDVADYLVNIHVNHPDALDHGHFMDVDVQLPNLAADIEREVNERTPGLWGESTSPKSLFLRVSLNSRPLMSLARILTPLALRCARTGEKPELKTLFGVGEFLYPKVLASVEKRLVTESLAAPHQLAVDSRAR